MLFKRSPDNEIKIGRKFVFTVIDPAGPELDREFYTEITELAEFKIGLFRFLQDFRVLGNCRNKDVFEDVDICVISHREIDLVTLAGVFVCPVLIIILDEPCIGDHNVLAVSGLDSRGTHIDGFHIALLSVREFDKVSDLYRAVKEDDEA